MATFRGGSGGYWNNYRCCETPKGTYRSVYHPGAPNEWVTIIAPGEATKDIATPALADWALVVERGELVIHYLKIEGDNRVEVRKPTGIQVGTAASTPPPAASTNGPTIAAIKAALAELQALVDALV